MPTLARQVFRFSVCPSCGGSGDWCPRCACEGAIPTPPGERPDLIVVMTPSGGGTDWQSFQVRTIYPSPVP